MFKERRRFQRLDYHTGVKWRNLTNVSKLMGEMPEDSKNIGAGGIRIISDVALKRGERLQLEFALPGQKRIAANGEVRWVVPMRSEDKILAYHAGVEFLEIDDHDRNLIDTYVLTSLPD
jgi:c-di-GMP-binding flagellar brake protein YcgR